MTFLVSDIVTDVRFLIQDENAAYRNADDRVVRVVNQVLRRMVVLRPDIFSTTVNLTAVAGFIQSIPADGMRLIDVLGDGTSLLQAKEINQDSLDTLVPGWPQTTPGPTVNWIRILRNPTKFYVYPPAVAGNLIAIAYVQVPARLALTDTINLQDAYYAAVVDGCVWILESLDAETVENGRAKMYQDSFNAALATGLQARKITDTPAAGEPPGDTLQ